MSLCGFQVLQSFGQSQLGVLELRDIGVDRDRAALVGLPFVDLNPETVTTLLYVGPLRPAMPLQARSDPFLDIPLGLGNQMAAGRPSDDLFEGLAR